MCVACKTKECLSIWHLAVWPGVLLLLLPWPAWSWLITLATFLKDYSNLRIVKYFLPLIDLFLYTWPEKKLPVNKFHALGSDSDQEGLAQRASLYLFKAEYCFLHFFRLKCYYHFQQKLQFFSLLSNPSGFISQPDVLHSPQCSLSVHGPVRGNKKRNEIRAEIWMDFSFLLSLLPVLYF